MLDFCQIHLIANIDAFLTTLNQGKKLVECEHLSSINKHGLCHGLCVLLMRAYNIQEEEIFWRRLTFLAGPTSQIVALAKLYLEFQQTFKVKDEKNFEIAQQLYFFIHTLLFSQNPAKVHLLHNKKSVTQFNITETLNIILPDKDVPLYLVGTFVFPFTEAEFAKTVLNMLKMGNAICLRSIHAVPNYDHVIYLHYKLNQGYVFYDPNHSRRPFISKNIHSLFAAMRKALFARFYITHSYHETDLLPTKIMVFTNQETKLSFTEQQLLTDCLTIRKTNTPNFDINTSSTVDNITALEAAMLGNQPSLLSPLLVNGANIRNMETHYRHQLPILVKPFKFFFDKDEKKAPIRKKTSNKLADDSGKFAIRRI